MSAPFDRAKQALRINCPAPGPDMPDSPGIQSESAQHFAHSIAAATDQVLDHLFGEIASSEPQDTSYPYMGTRPPLPPRGGFCWGKVLVLGVGLAFVGGLGWIGSQHWRSLPWVSGSSHEGVSSWERDSLSWPVAGFADPAEPLASELAASGLEAVELADDPADLSSPAQGETQANPVAAYPPGSISQTASAPVAPPSVAPPSPVTTAAVPPPAPILGPPAGIRLVGILRAPGDPVAMMMVDGRSHQAGVGGSVAGWQVISISPHSVVISNGSQRRILQISLGGG